MKNTKIDQKLIDILSLHKIELSSDFKSLHITELFETIHNVAKYMGIQTQQIDITCTEMLEPTRAHVHLDYEFAQKHQHNDYVRVEFIRMYPSILAHLFKTSQLRTSIMHYGAVYAYLFNIAYDIRKIDIDAYHTVKVILNSGYGLLTSRRVTLLRVPAFQKSYFIHQTFKIHQLMKSNTTFDIICADVDIFWLHLAQSTQWDIVESFQKLENEYGLDTEISFDRKLNFSNDKELLHLLRKTHRKEWESLCAKNINSFLNSVDEN